MRNEVYIFLSCVACLCTQINRIKKVISLFQIFKVNIDIWSSPYISDSSEQLKTSINFTNIAQ